MRRSLLLAAAVLLGVAMAACSDDDAGGDAIPIVATQSECRVAQTQLPIGKHSFSVENQGSEVTEVYVYAPGDKVVTEKEHIGPGTKASFSVKLDAGTYEIACKPGERGSGIRQTITVS